ncbi:hypothetical protein VTI74DRAFT_4870 [Chaetomium olivicolor]
MNNHPRNCGRCGNVCPSGICYRGRCYEPSAEPDVCIPGEAFRNGRFLNGSSDGWRADPNPSTKQPDFNVQFGAPDASTRDGYVALMTPVRDTVSYVGELVSEVRLCPGTSYDFRVLARLPRAAFWSHCAFQAVFGNRIVSLSALPAESADNGLAYGVSLAPYQAGEAGTYTTNKVYLGAEFRLRVICLNRIMNFGSVSLWGFSMYPA